MQSNGVLGEEKKKIIGLLSVPLNGALPVSSARHSHILVRQNNNVRMAILGEKLVRRGRRRRRRNLFSQSPPNHIHMKRRSFQRVSRLRFADLTAFERRMTRLCESKVAKGCKKEFTLKPALNREKSRRFQITTFQSSLFFCSYTSYRLTLPFLLPS